MPRPCTACRHPQREEINRALVNGEPFRNIAKRFGTSSTAVFRHKDHLPKALVKAQEAREVARADDLLGQVRDLQERALRVLGAAEAAGDLRAATGAIREARGCLELLGKVTGELVEKHAHIHAEIPSRQASEEARRAVESMPQDERRILGPPQGGGFEQRIKTDGLVEKARPFVARIWCRGTAGLDV